MSKEHAYAYEAGYRDGSINYELEHCPACKNVADLQEALADNAKLLEERDYYKALWEHATVTDCELRRVRAAWKEDREKNDKLRESLERATGIIADICGECPVSRYEWLSSDGCAEKCGTVTEEECWIAYLTGKRWDESGAEVDR